MAPVPDPSPTVSLAILRKRRQVTQVLLAAALGVSQSEVSRIERHPNVLLATVQSYVDALGGELELVVRFGDGEQLVLDIEPKPTA